MLRGKREESEKKKKESIAGEKLPQHQHYALPQ
jgi:hypothetical protein